MADWLTTWRPSYGWSFGPEYRTLISGFDSGTEQRRLKWGPRMRFFLRLDTRTEAIIQAIMEFHKDRSGAYESFTFPCFGESIKGTRLACVNSNPDTITDSSSGFVLKGFDASHDITIAGSGASNDDVYGIQTVAAGTLTLDNAEALSAESANASLEVFKTYTVRFVSDTLTVRCVTYGSWSLDVDLIEVL